MSIRLEDLGPAARAHVERQRAEQRAREERERLAALTQAEVNRLEHAEQALVRRVFLAFGAEVFWLSQARRTGQTAGLPDLWVFLPRHGHALWWETKRAAGGWHSAAQTAFGASCAATGAPYGTGTAADAEQWLIDQRIAYRDVHGVLEPVRDILHPA